MSRLELDRIPHLFISGAFVRASAGGSYPVLDRDGDVLARAALARAGDVDAAVGAARAAQPGWVRLAPTARGAALQRLAELLEGRTEQLAAEVAAGEGLSAAEARTQVGAGVDLLVSHAGWTDKLAALASSANPVAGPYRSATAPVALGVVGVVAPARPSLHGLLAAALPPLVTGNTVVVVASRPHPLPALSFAEVVAASDLPDGVVNLVTGDPDELAPALAGSGGVDALDLGGVPADGLATLERAAADRLAPVRRAASHGDPTPDDAVERMLAFTAPRTTWHPVGP